MSKDKTFRESLPCQLTDTEKLAKGSFVASKLHEIARLEGSLTSIKAQYGADIKRCTAELQRETECISSGVEFREIECRVERNHPKQGKKTVFRLDTDAIVRTVDMDKDDFQLVLLEDEAEPKPDDDYELSEGLPVDKNGFPLTNPADYDDDPPVEKANGDNDIGQDDLETYGFEEDPPPTPVSPMGLRKGDRIGYKPSKRESEAFATVVEVLPDGNLKIDRSDIEGVDDIVVIKEDKSVRYVPAESGIEP